MLERNIFNNLFLTRDMIKFTKEKNNYFYVLQIDQEKAFDKIDTNFLFKTMQKLGVSPLYINFIKTLYTNNTSTIINNGFLSSPISLETDKQRSHHVVCDIKIQPNLQIRNNQTLSP